MSKDERWMGPVVRHGVEARLDDRTSPTRVMVFLDETGTVRWGPTGEGAVENGRRHSFHFWVHRDTDSTRLDAIQILCTKLAEAGHRAEVVTAEPGGEPTETGGLSVGG